MRTENAVPKFIHVTERAQMLKKVSYVLDAAKRLFWDIGLAKSILGKPNPWNPLPWISYPAIEFLNSMEMEHIKMFEFGSGNSTLYWGQRLRQGHLSFFQSIESSPEYWGNMAKISGFYRDYTVLRKIKDDYLNYPYQLATRFTNDESKLIPFDFMVVDGPIQWRVDELLVALRLTHSEGIIMVDDTNWIAKDVERLCEEHSMFRVDFAGFGPGVSYTKVTSFLFRNPGWFLGNKVKTPMGGMQSFPGM